MIEDKRFTEIDALRGIAAMVVVLHHFLSIYDRDFGHSFHVPGIFNFGFYGVELFFVISGFVIYYTIEKSKNAGHFLIRRFIRLYPTYWICMTITFLLVWLSPLSKVRDTSLLEFLLNGTMINGIVGVKYVDPSYWSLQIELFFYLMMSFLLFTNKLKNIYLILWAWLLLILVYQEIVKLPGLGALLNLRYGSLFVAGICFYKIKSKTSSNTHSYILLIASLITSLVVSRYAEGSLIAIPLIYALFAVIILVSGDFLRVWPLVFMGNISYALYLIHQNVGFVILNQLGIINLTGPFTIIVPISFSIILAALITFYIERPFIRYLNGLLLTFMNRKAANV